jgi:hypothetical protein
MRSLVKPVVLGAGLVLGLGMGAQAQTVAGPAPGPSVASLPPASAPMAGPRTNSYLSVPGAAQTSGVAPSPAYIGPKPGDIPAPVQPHFEKSADWDNDPTMRPYENGKGPKPN